ncbi:MAG TPA: mechanosensitive ion channel domain-containing protein [Polyangiaceae bacterium]|nr:mechanosensitive ion channel domain-containing protein [Polyangiaceae bacterium]
MTDLSKHVGAHSPWLRHAVSSQLKQRGAPFRLGTKTSLLLVCLTSYASAQADSSEAAPTPVHEQATGPKQPAPVRRAKPVTTGAKAKASVDKSSVPTSSASAAAEGHAGLATNDAGIDAGPIDVDAGSEGAAPVASSRELLENVAGASATSPAATTASTVSTAPPVEFETTEVKIRDAVVLRLKLADGGLVPQERAKRATRAIEAALADGKPDGVRTELRSDRALLFVGQRPIIELTRADAEAIGEGSLEMFAASAAAKVRDVLETEHQRSIVAHNAFNVALVVMLGVAALYALRLLGALSRRLREFVRMNPDRIPAIRLRSIEVVGPHVLRSGLVVGLGVIKLLLQLTLVFAWLLFSSSMFEATRGMTGQLTALVLSPLSGLAARFVALLPVLLLTTIGVVALVVLLRFVSLFFAGVERSETELSWLRPELAAPTSLLIRIALVVISLLLLAPLLTGNSDGSLARVGMLSVGAIALATIPFLANIVVGLVTLYGSRLQMGDEIRIGGYAGTLVSVDLVELRLDTPSGQELRIPHLVTLVHPLAVAKKHAPCFRRLVVTAETPFARLVEVLSGEQQLADLGSIVLTRLEGSTASVELTPKQAGLAAEQQLLVQVARLLEENHIRLILAEWRPLA